MSFFLFPYQLSFEGRRLWTIIVMLLFIPSPMHSQPLDHFDSSLLSPVQKGEFLLARSLNDEALRLYQSLISEGKEGGYAFRGMVRAYESMDKLEEAKSWINGFLVDNPSSSPALYAAGYIYYLQKDMGKAKQIFNQALEFNANNALALNNLGAVLSHQKLYAQGAKQVRAAISINPKEPMFFYNLESIYKKMGNPGLIIADYNLSLERGFPNLSRGYGMAVGRSMRQTGFRLYSEGRLDDAILKFMEIETVYKNIKHQLGLVPVYFSLGLLHEERGDLQNAKKFFNLVLTFNPLHIQAKERVKNLQ